ncbi:MAG: DEAD/DEAH box helicase [Candidatus Hodarchaeales archaeon]
MPLIGTSSTRKKHGKRLSKASSINKISSTIENDIRASYDPDIGEIEPINDIHDNNLRTYSLLPTIDPIKIISPSDWSSVLDMAAEDRYDIIHLIEQPAETIQKGIAIDDLGYWFPPSLLQLLKQKGVNHLYRFQVEALELILEAEDAVITAPTGAGKTEAFLLPIIARYYSELQESKEIFLLKQVKVLVIYPTKALAADQFGKFQQFLKTGGFTVDIFDGDTSQVKRRKIFASPPTVLITNMDILHYNLRKEDFKQLINNIETVIIDEIHVYESVLGTNLMWILERLERVVNGNYFQVIAASATVANAEEFVSLLVKRPIKGVHCLQGRKTSVVHALVSSSLTNLEIYPRGSDRSFSFKSALVVSIALSTGSKVLVFEDSRRGAEELFMHIIKTARGQLKSDVHHAGLSATTRRRTEESLKKGNLQVLVATPTMELGIDIGDIDVIVSSPVPVNRLLQRFGRGGRYGQSCLAITDLSGNSPANEYYRRNPEEFLRSASAVYFDPNSEKVAFYQEK